MPNTNDKIKALKIELDDLDMEVKQSKYDKCLFETPRGAYLVLTDKEADEKCKDYIKDTLWAFNTSYILQHMKGYQNTTDYEDRCITKALSKLQEDLCETANPIIERLIDNLDEFVEDAINDDGRGHFLASYDGDEREVEVDGTKYFIYKN